MEGGSCNDYDYACGDPVNGLDLDGRWCKSWECARRADKRPVSERCTGASYRDGLSDMCYRYRLAKVTGRPELALDPSREAINRFEGDIISRNAKDFNPYQCAVDFGSAITSGETLARIGKVVETAKYAPGAGKAVVLGVTAGYSVYSVVNSGRKALSSCI